MKILAVDDDPLLLETLELMLPTAGYADVHVALGSHEALKLLKDPANHFDCFLIDIQMPDIDGVELVGKIHAMPRFETAPKIMLTAMSEIDYINRAFTAGATDYLTKPFEYGDIKTRLSLAENRVKARNLPAAKAEERLELPDIRYLMSIDVLSNYLASLGRLNLLLTEFYLVSIDGFDHLTKPMSALSEFNLIEEICHEFSECILGGDAFFCYLGDGEFVFAFNGRSLSVDEDFATRLRLAYEAASIAVLEVDENNIAPLSLSVLVKPGIFKDRSGTILDGLITRLHKAKKHNLSNAYAG